MGIGEWQIYILEYESNIFTIFYRKVGEDALDCGVAGRNFEEVVNAPKRMFDEWFKNTVYEYSQTCGMDHDTVAAYSLHALDNFLFTIGQE